MSLMAEDSSFLKNSLFSGVVSREAIAWRSLHEKKDYGSQEEYRLLDLLILNSSEEVNLFKESLHLILVIDTIESLLIQILQRRLPYSSLPFYRLPCELSAVQIASSDSHSSCDERSPRVQRCDWRDQRSDWIERERLKIKVNLTAWEGWYQLRCWRE